jgi:YbbR domain-containing protein
MIRILRRVFLRNWGLKLFSFLVAFILWLALIPEEKTFAEKTLTVSLELYNIPSGMDVVEKPPSTVDVKIRAPKRLIGQITPANVRASLDLRNARPDVENYPLNESMITVPPGAEVKEVRPRQVTLKLERTVALMLDVEPHIIGELREGLGVVKIEVVPPQVLVRGPESKINPKEKIMTTPIDLSSLTQSTEVEANLILPSPDLQFASAQTAVRVKILIQEDKIEEKTQKKKVGGEYLQTGGVFP